MAVEPKKKKLRPNERFVWGPQPCSWPRGVFVRWKFLVEGKKLDKTSGERLHSSNIFFGGGWKCLLTLNRFMSIFSHGETQQVLMKIHPKKKLCKKYTKTCQSYYSWNSNAENVPMWMKRNDNKMSLPFFGARVDFHFPWRWTELHHSDGWNPVKRWNWRVVDWPPPPPRMPVEMVDEDAETKPPPQEEKTPKMASAPTPEAQKAGPNCGEGLGRQNTSIYRVCV